MKVFVTLTCLYALSFINCKSNAKQKDALVSSKKNNKEAVGNLYENAEKFDSLGIDNFLDKYPKFNSIKMELDSFYYDRQYSFVWHYNKIINPQYANLYNHLKNIADDGKNNQLPYLNEFKLILDHKKSETKNIELELMLSAQYFNYTKTVWTGLSEKQTKAINWYLPRSNVSHASMLDSLLQGKDVLANPPVYRQYGLLKTELKKYKGIKNSGGFPYISNGDYNFKISDSSILITNLNKWLSLSGDLTASNATNIYDEQFVQGIKKVQHHFGFKEDGIINASLIKEMNVPIETRIEQISLNMERSRWLPLNSLVDYVVVNIPEYKLHVYENNAHLWDMDVVVGRAANKTVLFSGNIKYVVFSPYWNVPSGILRKEVLPGIRRNRNYLAKHNMEWHDGKVRERPGPNNSLGLVKFLFPNNYDIYLHDTPAKSLFGQSSRAFSHGCIRLADAEKFANYLLKNDTVWTPQKINTAMNAGAEQFVNLKKAEAVYIVYFTTWVDVNGQLNFRKDIYGRDEKLKAMLL